MSEKIQAVRGMNDILPAQTPAWRYLESCFYQVMQSYGFEEIRFPLVESTQLFKRSIGEVTDIVEKEMYTFNDLNGDSLTLRPEGTAGCVRACIQHGLLYNQIQKLWYMGPMFRHERPQKGRYRQFSQFGVEAFGIAGAAVEVELIALSRRLWQQLGIDQAVKLQINSLGTLAERQAYKEVLVRYFEEQLDCLDEDSQRRLGKNPLRILDSKNPAMASLIASAPRLLDHLGEDSRAHFDSLCAGLRHLGIDYEINPTLVRGLDYYGHTVFEWVTAHLGSQATVCAGGRYDLLLDHLGASNTPAVGFAMGAERLLLLMETLSIAIPDQQLPGIYIIADGHAGMQTALFMAESLRQAQLPYTVHCNTAGGGFKSQFKKADKSGARFALILGEEELANKQVSIKFLREAREQITLPQADLIHYLQNSGD